MAWTTPRSWSVNELLTASLLNTHLRDNLLALKAPPTASYVFAGPYTTTSTSEVDVDTTNLTLTIVTTGGDVLVGWLGTVHMSVSGNTCTLNVTMDGANLLSIGNVGQFNQANLIAGGFTALKTPVAAGAHTFKLRWKVSANQANMGSGMFWVREVS